MYPYSLDIAERKTTSLFIAVAAILAAWLLNHALVAISWTVPWWFDPPSVMGFYGIFYTVFDRYIWSWRPFSFLRFSNIPVLAGEWSGTIISSFNDGTTIAAKLTIKQTWTDMQVALTTESSASHSLAVALAVKGAGGPTLTYQYQNDPRAGAVATMQIHYGTANLILEGNRLTGEYYSGRGRQNIGELSFDRTTSQLR